MTEINALVFRRKFGKILDRVAKKHESIVILRGNKPLVVLTPYDLYGPMRAEEERRERLGKTIENMKRWRERNAEALKDVDPAAAIREMRDSR